MNITLTPYRPAQKGKKNLKSNIKQVWKVCAGPKRSPSLSQWSDMDWAQSPPRVWKLLHLTAKLYRLHSSCRIEHLARRDGHTDLWDWGLGGVKVCASGLNKMLQGSWAQHWECGTQRRGGSKTAASCRAGQGFCQNQLPVYWWLSLFYSNYTNRTERVTSVPNTCNIKNYCPRELQILPMGDKIDLEIILDESQLSKYLTSGTEATSSIMKIIRICLLFKKPCK